MFKGLRALFTSGIIFNPMVLFGIISGVWGYANLDAEKLKRLFSQPVLSGAVFLVSLVYSLVFAKVYKSGGAVVDWSATLWNVVAGVLRYLAAFVLTMSFIGMINIF